MNLLIYLAIGWAAMSLVPEDASATHYVLAIGIQVLVFILDIRSHNQGLQAGKDIVWKALAETLRDKNIESLTIKSKVQHAPENIHHP